VYDPISVWCMRERGTGLRGTTGFEARATIFTSSRSSRCAQTRANLFALPNDAGRQLGLRRDPTPLLATLTIDGQQRRVLMQANKNAFFYVLDREKAR